MYTYYLVNGRKFGTGCYSSLTIVLLVSLSSFEKDTLDVFEPMVYLQDGGNLNEYGVDAKVIELPGHTEGSIGLGIEGDKLFVGDALMNMFYPTISMLYTDKDKMLESAKRIGEMGAKTIYFGHGIDDVEIDM